MTATMSAATLPAVTWRGPIESPLWTIDEVFLPLAAVKSSGYGALRTPRENRRDSSRTERISYYE